MPPFFQLHVRALFDFDPVRDAQIPCTEAGVPFTRGDVLQVLSQQDPDWWQVGVGLTFLLEWGSYGLPV